MFVLRNRAHLEESLSHVFPMELLTSTSSSGGGARAPPTTAPGAAGGVVGGAPPVPSSGGDERPVSSVVSGRRWPPSPPSPPQPSPSPGTSSSSAGSSSTSSSSAVWAAIAANPGLLSGFLEHGVEIIRTSRRWVKTAVKQKGWLLQFAADELRDDFEIVANAVQQDGCALQYASERLRQDGEFLKTIIPVAPGTPAKNKTASAFQYAAPVLRANRQWLASVLGARGELTQTCPEALSHVLNRDFLLAIMEVAPWQVDLFPRNFRFDKEIVSTQHKKRCSPRLQRAGQGMVYTSQPQRSTLSVAAPCPLHPNISHDCHDTYRRGSTGVVQNRGRSWTIVFPVSW